MYVYVQHEYRCLTDFMCIIFMDISYLIYSRFTP